MWELQLKPPPTAAKANCSPEKITILSGKDITVGRKEAEILLTEDQSISRKHATLRVKFSSSEVTNPSSQPRLFITDFSKFGTFVNNQNLNGGTVQVENGAIIKFGQLHNIYDAVFTPLRVCASSVSLDSKTEAIQLLSQIGGHLVNEWPWDSDLPSRRVLLMDRTSLTMKAVYAMSCLAPLVTLQYLRDVVDCASNQKELPNALLYPPGQVSSIGSIADEMWNSPADGDVSRSKVFEKTTFYFCNKGQYTRMKPAVDHLSGKTVLLEKRPRSLTILVEPAARLMHAPDSVAWYKEAIAYLARRSKRCIQDAEIGHAILHRSTVDYCNPDIKAGERLYQQLSQRPSDTQTDISRIVETQDVNHGADGAERSALVQETLDRSSSSDRNPRRSLDGPMLPAPTTFEVAETQSPARRARNSNHTSMMGPPAPVSPSTSLPTRTNDPLNERTARSMRASLKRGPDEQANAEKASRSNKRSCPANDSTTAKPDGDNTPDTHSSTVTHTMLDAPSIPDIETPCTTLIEQEQETADTLIIPQSQDDSTLPVNQLPTTQPLIVTTKPLTVTTQPLTATTQPLVPSTIKPSHSPELADVNRAVEADGDVAKENISRVKSEPVSDLLYNMPPVQPMANVKMEFSEERREQIGLNWDMVEVGYADLLRTTQPQRKQLQEHDGKTLWEGKWVKNFKRFKKNGRRLLSGLPLIIGGSDLFNGLNTQPATEFYDEPDAAGDAPSVTPESFTTTSTDRVFDTPSALTNGASNTAFGGGWDLPI